MRELWIEILRPEHLLFYAFAYGLASTPTSWLVARSFHGIDLKKQKGHSHTASYLWRSWSKPSGFLVFCLDLLKGLIPCAIAHSLGVPLVIIALIGLCAVIGQCFSWWLWFLGGQGSVTSAGALLFIAWPAALIMLTVNLALILMRMSPGFSAMLTSLLGTIIVFWLLENKVAWSIVAAMTLVIIIRHQFRHY